MALKLLLLLLALSLTACVSTPLPPGGYKGSSSHYVKRQASRTKVLVYRVRRGDTLYSIGRRFGVDYHLLARRNHMRAPYEIYIGQHLYISSVAPRSQQLPSVVTRSRHAGKSAKSSKSAKKSSLSTPHRTANSIHTKFLWPVRGTVTSQFGRRGSRMHDGIDIGAARGTPVVAAASGKVVYADHRLSGYGKLVIIRHSGNVFTAYAHNQRNLVRKGDRVRAGSVIARVGSSGRATGAHLHFEVRRGSTPVDPLAYLPRR